MAACVAHNHEVEGSSPSPATMNSKSVGEITEALILARLVEMGMSVSIPFGNNQRYDLIVDDGERLIRAQCKTGRMHNGCVTFGTSSINGFTGEKRDYEGQIDVFLVYCPQTKGFYWIPLHGEKATKSKRTMSLRVHPAIGGTKSHIKWARDYEF